MTFITRNRVIVFGVLIVGLASLSEAQRHGRPPVWTSQPKSVVLRIEGRVPHPLFLSLKDLRSYPRSTIQVPQTTGEPALYEGVALIELLRRAGAPMNAEKKEELRTYVEAISRKGHVIFSLAELDPAFVNSNLIVADRLNGSSVDAQAGLLLIAGSDKISSRSLQHLIAIRVRRVR